MLKVKGQLSSVYIMCLINVDYVTSQL